MKRFVVFAMLLVVVSMSSCIKWKCCINGDFVQVYKTKGDYTNNAYVLYNKNKDYIYGYYDDVDTTLFPMPLYGGYYLHHEMSPDAAFLSISPKKYNENVMNYSIDTLKQMIIDDDPFIEFFSATDNYNLYDNNSSNPMGIDTAYINQLIKEGDLKKEFKKVK
jgi:hypothetical protein